VRRAWLSASGAFTMTIGCVSRKSGTAHLEVKLGVFALSESIQSYAREVFSVPATHAPMLDQILAGSPLGAQLSGSVGPPLERFESQLPHDEPIEGSLAPRTYQPPKTRGRGLHVAANGHVIGRGSVGAMDGGRHGDQNSMLSERASSGDRPAARILATALSWVTCGSCIVISSPTR